MDNQKIVSLILRIGVAFVFVYAAIGLFVAPDNWIGYFPDFLRQTLPQQVLVLGFSVFELVLGIWILSGKFLFFSSILATAVLIGIILLNLAAFDIVFRDVAIVFSTIALSLLSFHDSSRK